MATRKIAARTFEPRNPRSALIAAVAGGKAANSPFHRQEIQSSGRSRRSLPGSARHSTGKSQHHHPRSHACPDCARSAALPRSVGATVSATTMSPNKRDRAIHEEARPRSRAHDRAVVHHDRRLDDHVLAVHRPGELHVHDPYAHKPDDDEIRIVARP